ncbi:hypothetical protein D3C87_1345120 [compost metagenome]
MQILPLQVLNHLKLKHFEVVDRNDADGYMRQLCNSGRAPAPLSGNQLEFAGFRRVGAAEDGLQNAMLSEAACELLQGFRIEALARVGLGGNDVVARVHGLYVLAR